MKADGPRTRLFAMCCAAAGALAAQGAHAKEIHVPAGDLMIAMDLLAQQSGAQVIYQVKQLKGMRTSGVDGDLSPEQALERLIEGTHLVVHMDASGAMLVSLDADRKIGVPTENPTMVALRDNRTATKGNREPAPTSRDAFLYS